MKRPRIDLTHLCPSSIFLSTSFHINRDEMPCANVDVIRIVCMPVRVIVRTRRTIMGSSKSAAVTATVILAGLIVFQSLLAAGLPLGDSPGASACRDSSCKSVLGKSGCRSHLSPGCMVRSGQSRSSTSRGRSQRDADCGGRFHRLLRIEHDDEPSLQEAVRKTAGDAHLRGPGRLLFDCCPFAKHKRMKHCRTTFRRRPAYRLLPSEAQTPCSTYVQSLLREKRWI
jgi:hypothetical protein